MMNLLKGNLLIKGVNLASPVLWCPSNTLKLSGSDVKYLPCKEFRCRPITWKTSTCDMGKYHEVLPSVVRNYSDSPFRKIREYINDRKLAFRRRNQSGQLAFFLYRSIETVNYKEFNDFLELPDTFYSWFAFLELHIWMLMSQVMGSQNSGFRLRNDIVRVMWFDVEERCRNLGPVKKKVVKQQLAELSDRLPVTLLLYDEGLMGTDTTLATALWYKIFEKQCDDPSKLEVLVRYIRHQIHHLSSLELNDLDIMKEAKIIWIPFSDHVKAVTAL